ncbi:MAG: DNA primase [Chloroflexi bacterium]|nr:DNA primase [Chloroflexota bacterium]
MSVADEIKARLDIVNYVTQYVPLKKAGRTYKAPCPFHSEKTPSFVVDPVRQSWRCYGACATGGDVINFAMKRHGWSFTEALQELAQQTGVQLKKRTPEQRDQEERAEKLRGLLRTSAETFNQWLTFPDSAPAAHRQSARETLDYAIRKRALTDETIGKFLIGYAPPDWTTLTDLLKQIGYSEDEIIESGMAIRNEHGRVYDRFRNRLIIPIRDDRGRVVGFGARALKAEDNPKYLNTPETPLFNKSRLLFGLDTAKAAIRESETVVIVEGYLDAITAQQAGFGNVVAQMGTALTDQQLKLVAPKYAKRVLLALDSDAAGQNATMRSLEVARRALSEDYAGRLQIEIGVLNIPGAKDPDDFIRESPNEWSNIVASYRPVADFVIDFETRDLPHNASIMEKESVARRLLPLLMASERDLYKQDNLQKLAARLKIAEKTLLAWAAAEARENAKQPRSAPRPRTQDIPDDLPPTQYTEPPPEFDEFGDPVPYDGPEPEPSQPRSVAGFVAPSGDMLLEVHCLQYLIDQPMWLYHINRRLRLLAGDERPLMEGPFADLHELDFSDTAHQIVWKVLSDAINQDALAHTDAINQGIATQGVEIVDRLRMARQDILRDSIRSRFEGDAAVAWTMLQQRIMGPEIAQDDLIRTTLRLRLRRIQRESEDLQLMLAEAEAAENQQQAKSIFKLTPPLLRAKRLLDAELGGRLR